MKKVRVIAILLIGFLMITACKSKPPTEADFQRVYDRYSGSLILDGATTYTVKAGDTLASIAKNLYNDGFYYPLILLASGDVITDPDKIVPGIKLTIPNLQRNLADPGARAKIKSYLLEIARMEEARGRIDTAKGLRQHANAL